MTVKIFRGKVIKGEGWGSLIGFPTANLDKKNLSGPRLPAGVYACYVRVGSGGNCYKGLTIAGVKSFFKDNGSKLEIYILDFKKKIVGKFLEVEIVKKLRRIKKFANTEELVKQASADESAARQILK